MKKRYSTTLFIFRRDLRIEDNTGLRTASELSEKVLPCFIFTPEQIGNDNTYKGLHSLQFMIESLKELAESIHEKGGFLYFFYGTPATIVANLLQKLPIEAVFVNRDYTPYSKARDIQIAAACSAHKVAFESFPDILLLEPEDALTVKGTPYKVFTPFFTKNRVQPIAQPIYTYDTHFATQDQVPHLPVAFLNQLTPTVQKLHVQGGRTHGMKLLTHIPAFAQYKATHDQLTLPTTSLSAHSKFGTISIREVYHTFLKAVGPDNGLIRQLYWRDFFTHVAWFNPSVFGHAFEKKFEHITWSKSTRDFERWCTGTTGFPLVDAGMRELNATGYMHNRARLIVGSFLTKDLHISWQWGERYFAQQLTDYDPSVNNGNWQWVASTGCDAQPYFRIFNPWLQQKKFDPQATYIKRWIPELNGLEPKIIHTWYKQESSFEGYPLPMVNHTIEAQKAKKLFQEASSSFHEDI